MAIQKTCARCNQKFPRLGGTCGLLGILICFLLFGGTSKYCPSCRSALKQEGKKVDKGFVTRLIWIVVALVIILAILNA